jgi:hypothetical protein
MRSYIDSKIESKVLRQGQLVEGEIVPLNELEKSDWLEKLLHKKDNSTLAKTYENSPVKPNLSGKAMELNRPV